MCHQDITLIPLHHRDGSVRAYTLIDTDDADWVQRDRWFLGADDYAVRSFSGETIFLHREIMDVGYGDPIIIDHVNRQRLDNRRSNLRKVTHAQNNWNRSKKAPASSIHRGVSLKKADPKIRMYRDRWVARATHNGIMHHLGYFDREEDAAEAVQAFHQKFS